ncbi:alpha/beta hydrolase [Bradyrhizobium sp. 180]|uniref:alpha/beta hydrolase n=1 Tax=unclassified Bradyrhizobium TaxID=2631580 RepID=UPI001FF74F66|nr:MULTISPECIES: alpha/beta hydrolase [unclassified Bradyrhizobium]MCK1424546.1 alpha/beta hydrolase [Bradyrhizobium sp. CW12]MCK1494812.1 alpha/beta hydrolase [Bradyrhizobium sp. 180]MCK1595910.1 alpha/beta hydrolase [Bradyrhizobium sp. 164]MCK1646409.1 alpha/beta hydrolase [Bradyrhizobium sp. 154]MCK1758705.1 alpha/beta hydrolase [Bradyrhizobium sp. 137]
MVGAVPKLRANARADRTTSGARGRVLRVGLILALVPLSLTLVQCGKAPNPAALAANSQANVQVVAKTNAQVASGDTFEDRFPAPQFKERFPSASESLLQRQMSDFSPKRAVQQQPQAEQAPYKVASLEPQLPYKRPPREDLTTLVSMKSSAFPYFGNNPASDAPFLNISKGDRRGHRSYSGRVYWQDETYSDSRVLVHVPEHFDVRKPGVIVVFFHGNGATLERDVRDRQLVPKQITDSGANAVLLAPQMAVDAADSSAGKFWQAGGFKRFMEESANHLARLTGDPNSARAFANMPIVIVGYSGGFLPTAWSLEVGGISDRVRGVVLLDAVYGEMDKFAAWIESHRSGFFVSAYTRYTARRDRELMSLLRQKGISVSEDMDEPLRPGSVVFVETGEGITHRDYVTRAWTRDPLKDVLVKMSATPALTRVASTNPPASSR